MSRSKTLLLIWAVISCGLLQAQTTIKKTMKANHGNEVVLDFKFANKVSVSTWNKDEVYLLASIKEDGNEDEHWYQIESDIKGNEIRFVSNADEFIEKWQKYYDEKGDCHCGPNPDITVLVKIPDYLDLSFESISGSIELEKINGRLDLNTISGDITIKSGMQKLFAKSISGDVEILVDNDPDVNLMASTITGEIYSNLEIEFLDDKNGLRRLIGSKVEGKLNNGGTLWEMETVSGNIFMRNI